jgi:hypothetical protein
MVPPRRQLKRESTIVVDGLITPNESMSTTGTITPKQEDSSISFSDNFEDKFAGASFRSHDGLPLEDDDHVIAERQRRSASGKSQPQPLKMLIAHTFLPSQFRHARRAQHHAIPSTETLPTCHQQYPEEVFE